MAAMVVVMRSGDGSRRNVCFLDVGMATAGFGGREKTHFDFV